MYKVYNQKTREVWIGIIMLMVAVVYIIGCSFIKRSNIVAVGAEFMPLIYGWMFFFLSVCQIISGVRNYLVIKAQEKAEEAEEASSEGSEKDNPSVKENLFFKKTLPILITFALIIFCVAIMKTAGFIISGSILMFGMCILLTPNYAKKRYVVFAVFSIVTSLLAFFLFKNVLYVSLPSGIIFG